MALESDADRLAGLQALGDQLTTVAGTATWGIWDDAFLAVDGVAGTGPQFVGRTSDLSAVTRATVVARAGVNYRPVSIEPDGTGMTTLQLERT